MSHTSGLIAWWRIGVTCLAIVMSRAVDAQELRGAVLDSVSRVGVPGAVLLLRDGSAKQVGRTITNERGVYRVALPPEAVTVRVLRLGFRPRDVAIPTLTGGAEELDILVAQVPTLLDPVVTKANPQCPRRSDVHAAFALWQHARSGLLATIVARENLRARATVLVYQRILTGPRDSIAEQRVHADTGQWSTPFRAAYSAAEFVRSGFVERAKGQPDMYYGPDAEVLLDDAFQAAYCFELAHADASRPELAGLRFTPARRQHGRVDIDGTLWIDTTARSLRDIEFRYGGLAAATDRFRPGGRIEFLEMPNGAVVIHRWSLRLVRGIAAAAGPALSRTPGQWGQRDSQYSHFDLTDGGGELARADWADGTSWRAPLGTLRLRLLDQQRAPMAGTRLQLDSTDYTATTDSTGYLEIDQLLPGPYKGVIVDSALETIGVRLRTPIEFVAVRDSVVGMTVVVHSIDDVLRSQCGTGSPPDSSMVIGRVVNTEGDGVKGARWTIAGQRGPVNEDGIFMPCQRFERGRQIQISAWRDRGLFGDVTRTVTVTLTHRITPVSIELPLKP